MNDIVVVDEDDNHYDDDDDGVVELKEINYPPLILHNNNCMHIDFKISSVAAAAVFAKTYRDRERERGGSERERIF